MPFTSIDFVRHQTAYYMYKFEILNKAEFRGGKSRLK